MQFAMDRYSAGNRFLDVGAFVVPFVPITVMAAGYGGTRNFSPSLMEFCLLWMVSLSVSYMLIIIHELGHILAGRLVGIEIESVNIGHWRRLTSFTAGSLKISLRAAPSTGYVLPKGLLQQRSVPALVFFLLGGVLAEAVLVFFALRTTWPDYLSSFGEMLTVFVRTNVIWVGSWQILVNLFPFETSVSGIKHPSDGLQLCRLWQQRHNRGAQAQLLAEFQRIDQLQQAKQYTEAIEQACRLATAHPENFELLQYIGALHLLNGDSAKAEAIYRQLLKKPLGAPAKFAEILDMLACLLIFQRRMDLLTEADGWSNEALRYVPEAITLKGTRASILIELGKWDEGITMLQEVLKHTECPVDQAISYAYLAKAHAAKGSPSDARRYFEKALATDPTHVVVEHVKGELSSLGLLPTSS